MCLKIKNLWTLRSSFVGPDLGLLINGHQFESLTSRSRGLVNVSWFEHPRLSNKKKKKKDKNLLMKSTNLPIRFTFSWENERNRKKTNGFAVQRRLTCERDETFPSGTESGEVSPPSFSDLQLPSSPLRSSSLLSRLQFSRSH